jgi:hypothetical protein
MRKFHSLNPIEMPQDANARDDGEMPVVQVEESPGKIQIRYAFPGFYLADDDRTLSGDKIPFRMASVPGAGRLSESGKPELPSFGRYVQIPYGANWKIATELSQPFELTNVMLSPAQAQLTDDPQATPVFEFDKSTYSRNALYPQEPVEVTGPFEIDGYRSLLLHVRPCQYNPAQKKLVGHGNVTVTITFSEQKGAPPPPIDGQTSREVFGNAFLNPRRGIEERLAVGKQIGLKPIKPKGPEYIILYHDAFAAPAKKLAQWKNLCGLKTETKPISAVGTTSEAIKSYIRGQRGQVGSRLGYVLLLGDVEQIPPSDAAGQHRSDYYYATQTDAPAMGGYVMPWLAVGRIPVQKLADANSVVDEIIAYERNPPADPQYYKRMAFAAYFQDGQLPFGRTERDYLQTLEEIRSHMIALGYDVQRVYVSDGHTPQFYRDGTAVAPDVQAAMMTDSDATAGLVDSIRDGALVLAHRDHGWEEGWSKPPLTRAHLDSVTTPMPSVFFSVNCLTGQFDKSEPSESFAEMVLRKPGMAPSIIAATRVSGTWRNDALMKGLFDAVWPGVLPTFPAGSTVAYAVRNQRLGDMLNYAKSYLPVLFSGDPAGVRDHLEIYHVLGDPTLQLWTDAPKDVGLRARVRTTIKKPPFLRTTTEVQVQLNTCPEGTVVSLVSGNQILLSMEMHSTSAAFTLPPLTGMHGPGGLVARTLRVCFKAPGYRFQEARLSR